MLVNGYRIKRNVNSSSCILKLRKQLENNGFAKPYGKDIYVSSSAIFSGANILPAKIEAVANWAITKTTGSENVSSKFQRVRSRSFSRLSQGPSRPYYHYPYPIYD